MPSFISSRFLIALLSALILSLTLSMPSLHTWYNGPGRIVKYGPNEKQNTTKNIDQTTPSKGHNEPFAIELEAFNTDQSSSSHRSQTSEDGIEDDPNSPLILSLMASDFGFYASETNPVLPAQFHDGSLDKLGLTPPELNVLEKVYGLNEKEQEKQQIALMDLFLAQSLQHLTIHPQSNIDDTDSTSTKTNTINDDDTSSLSESFAPLQLLAESRLRDLQVFQSLIELDMASQQLCHSTKQLPSSNQPPLYLCKTVDYSNADLPISLQSDPNTASFSHLDRAQNRIFLQSLDKLNTFRDIGYVLPLLGTKLWRNALTWLIQSQPELQDPAITFASDLLTIQTVQKHGHLFSNQVTANMTVPGHSIKDEEFNFQSFIKNFKLLPILQQLRKRALLNLDHPEYFKVLYHAKLKAIIRAKKFNALNIQREADLLTLSAEQKDNLQKEMDTVAKKPFVLHLPSLGPESFNSEIDPFLSSKQKIIGYLNEMDLESIANKIQHHLINHFNAENEEYHSSLYLTYIRY
jgi:hypothetical protein